MKNYTSVSRKKTTYRLYDHLEKKSYMLAVAYDETQERLLESHYRTIYTHEFMAVTKQSYRKTEELIIGRDSL